MIKVETVYKYRDQVKVGNKVTVCRTSVNKMNMCERILSTTATVLSKYPYIVMTDKGVYRWADIFLWNKADNNFTHDEGK